MGQNVQSSSFLFQIALIKVHGAYIHIYTYLRDITKHSCHEITKKIFHYKISLFDYSNVDFKSLHFLYAGNGYTTFLDKPHKLFIDNNTTWFP